jgi:hypothetical protein
MRSSPERRRVAFLFLGETLLIPHLYPIVEALAAQAPALLITLWVATATHEALLRRWTAALRHGGVRIRRASGFRADPDPRAVAEGRNPTLPNKLMMLARLVPHLLGERVVVCAEQTSLWIPTLAPFLPMRFVKTSHGVGSMSARDDRRRRAAWRTLVPSERERRTYLDRGMAPGRIVATGYVKSGFRQHSHAAAAPLFAEPRPVVLYAPHWQRRRSSWWAWGEEIVRRLAADGRWNLIFAPHQRLAETAPEVRDLMAELAGHPNVHCDLDSFAMVDGSYTDAADLYLGDTSSLVIEYLARPRPCVFLNPWGHAWECDPSYDQWRCGEVVRSLVDLAPALVRAPSHHVLFAALQRDLAQSALGDTSGSAPARAAAEILKALG